MSGVRFTAAAQRTIAGLTSVGEVPFCKRATRVRFLQPAPRPKPGDRWRRQPQQGSRPGFREPCQPIRSLNVILDSTRPGKSEEQDRYLQRAPCATSPTAEASRSDRVQCEFKSRVAYQFARVAQCRGPLLKTKRSAGSSPATGTKLRESSAVVKRPSGRSTRPQRGADGDTSPYRPGEPPLINSSSLSQMGRHRCYIPA